MSLKIHQYRTFDQIYLFQSKDETTLSLKIYDLSRKRLSKESLQLESSQVQTLFQKHKANDFLRLFNKESLPLTSFLGSFFVELDHAIDLFKLQIPVENKRTEMFTCPITLEVLKDPVMDGCGHTFERAAIEQHQKNSSTCPISRKPINKSLPPNLKIRQAIDEWQKEDPIPTFASFKKINNNLARRNLDTAQECISEQEYEEALDAYTKAFQFTQNWEDYESLPLLFQKMGLPQKAHLAILYLVKYQLQAKEHEKALTTLETLLQENNPQLDLPLRMLLIRLYLETGHFSEALPLCLTTAQACERAHPQKAILLYRCLLNHNPTQWKLYPSLANLLSTPQEKAHLLLKGALLAIEAKENSTAEKLCKRAEQEYPNPFIDRLVHLQLLDRPLLNNRLQTLAQSYEESQDAKQSAKAYYHLTTIDPHPLYQTKFLQLHSILKPQKALQTSLKWLQTLLQEENYPAAETVAQVALDLFSKHPLTDPIPFYTALAHLHRHQNSPKLVETLTHLAQLYQAQGNLPLAEKIYQEIFQTTPTLDNTLALAQILELQKERLSEAVQVYYEAVGLCLLQDNFQRLEETIEKLLQLDPPLQNLKTAQKVQLMTQKHLCQLTKRVQELEALTKPQQPKLAFSPTQTTTPVIPQPVSVPLPACAFGKVKWATHFGDIGVEPPLPSNINQILQGPCPIWPGKTVQESHILVLIPTTVNGCPFTLKSLGELIQSPRTGPATKYRTFYPGQYQDAPVSQSYWTLITRDVIKGSRSQRYTTQKQQVATLAQKTGISYGVPNLLEATTAILMHHVSTGQRLYTDSPWTYTRCQEMYNAQWQMVVGGFSSGGLRIGNDRYVNEDGGVGVCRKL